MTCNNVRRDFYYDMEWKDIRLFKGLDVLEINYADPGFELDWHMFKPFPELYILNVS